MEDLCLTFPEMILKNLDDQSLTKCIALCWLNKERRKGGWISKGIFIFVTDFLKAPFCFTILLEKNWTEILHVSFIRKIWQIFHKIVTKKNYVYYLNENFLNPGLARQNRVFFQTLNQLLRTNGLRKSVISNSFFWRLLFELSGHLLKNLWLS